MASSIFIPLLAFFSLLAVQLSVSLLYKLSQNTTGGYSYSPLSAIAIAEMIKCLMAAGVLAMSTVREARVKAANARSHSYGQVEMGSPEAKASSKGGKGDKRSLLDEEEDEEDPKSSNVTVVASEELDTVDLDDEEEEVIAIQLASNSLFPLMRCVWRRFYTKLTTGLVMHMCGLAFLYFVNNQLSFILLLSVDVATASLFKSFSTLIAAVLLWVCFARDILSAQWMALTLQVVGLIVVLYDPQKHGTLYGFGAYALLLLSVSITAVCSVWNEYVVKNLKADLMSQNIVLYAFGSAFNIACFMLGPDFYNAHSAEVTPHAPSFFEGYTIMALLVIAANSVMGLVITAVYKYADAIIKTFATACATAALFVINIMFFHLPAKLEVLLGVAVVFLASAMYFQAAAAEGEKQSKLKTLQQEHIAEISKLADTLAEADPNHPTARLAQEQKRAAIQTMETAFGPPPTATFRCLEKDQRHKLATVMLVLLAAALIIVPLIPKDGSSSTAASSNSTDPSTMKVSTYTNELEFEEFGIELGGIEGSNSTALRPNRNGNKAVMKGDGDVQVDDGTGQTTTDGGKCPPCAAPAAPGGVGGVFVATAAMTCPQTSGCGQEPGYPPIPPPEPQFPYYTDSGWMERMHACLSSPPILTAVGPMHLDQPIKFRGAKLWSQCSIYQYDAWELQQPVYRYPDLGTDISKMDPNHVAANEAAIKSMSIKINGIDCYVIARSVLGDEFSCRMTGLRGVAALPVEGLITVDLQLHRTIHPGSHSWFASFVQAGLRQWGGDVETHPFKYLRQPDQAQQDVWTTRSFQIKRTQTFFEEKGILLGIFFNHPHFDRLPILRALHRLFPVVVYGGWGGNADNRPDRQGAAYVETRDEDWLQPHLCARLILEQYGEHIKPEGGFWFIHFDVLTSWWQYANPAKFQPDKIYEAQLWQLWGVKNDRDNDADFKGQHWWDSGAHMWPALKDTFKELKAGAAGEPTPEEPPLTQHERDVYKWGLENFQRNLERKVPYGNGDIVYLPYRYLPQFLILERVFIRNRLMHEIGWPQMVGLLGEVDAKDVIHINGPDQHDGDISTTQWMEGMATWNYFHRLRLELPESQGFTRLSVERSLPYDIEADSTWPSAITGSISPASIQAACPSGVPVEKSKDLWQHLLLLGQECAAPAVVVPAPTVAVAKTLPPDSSPAREEQWRREAAFRIALFQAATQKDGCFRCVLEIPGATAETGYLLDTAQHCWRSITLSKLPAPDRSSTITADGKCPSA